MTIVVRVDGRPAPLAEWRYSCREFAARVVRAWFGITVAGVGGVVGFADLALDGRTKAERRTVNGVEVVREIRAFEIPDAAWISLAVLGLFAAALVAFHEVRCERDRARDPDPGNADVEHLLARFGDGPGIASAEYQHTGADGSRTSLRIRARPTGRRQAPSEAPAVSRGRPRGGR